MLLEKHGLGGVTTSKGHNTSSCSFLIADKEEAWIMEVVGEVWAAERVQGMIGGVIHLSRINDAT